MGSTLMPAVSGAQQRFFGYLKSNPAEAAKRGISAKVVDEFAHAPGGTTKKLPDRVTEPKKKRRMFGSLSPWQ